MNKRIIRDLIRLTASLMLCWLYLPHILIYAVCGGAANIKSDLRAISHQLNIRLPLFLQLIYQLHNNRYFRHVFYYRIGPVWDMLISWYRPGDKYFWIPFSSSPVMRMSPRRFCRKYIESCEYLHFENQRYPSRC